MDYLDTEAWDAIMIEEQREPIENIRDILTEFLKTPLSEPMDEDEWDAYQDSIDNLWAAIENNGVSYGTLCDNVRKRMTGSKS